MKRALVVVVVAVVMACATAASGQAPTVASQRAGNLTPHDWSVLADFQNGSGDKAFDIGVNYVLAMQLGQSPYFSFLPESRIRDRIQGPLVQMQKSAAEPLTPAVALEVCRRENAVLVLSGSLSGKPDAYTVALAAMNCATGKVAAVARVRAKTREDVLTALPRVATEIRAKLKEPQASIKAHNVRVQATAATLEAFEAMKLSGQAFDIGDQETAIKHAERAAEIEPSFATAWLRAGTLLRNTSRTREQSQRANDLTTRAFGLRTSATEPERYAIEALYYTYVTREPEKAKQTYKAWISTYPLASTPHNNLALVYAGSGDYSAAFDEFREASKLAPGMWLYYSNMAGYGIAANRLEEAVQAVNAAIDRKIDNASMHASLYDIAFLKGDTAAMQREVEWARGKPAELTLLVRQSQVAACRGRLLEALVLADQANAIDERSKATQPIAVRRAAVARMVAFVGLPKLAESMADAVADVPAARVTTLFVYASAGNKSRLDSLIAKYRADPGVAAPEAVERNVAFAQAVAELTAGNGAKALDLLNPDKYAATSAWEALPYWRGYAYLAAKRPVEAVAEFEKIVAARHLFPTSGTWEFGHLGLARARAAAGMVSAARQSYETFFGFMKDGDPDLPALAAARAEYGRLAKTTAPN